MHCLHSYQFCHYEAISFDHKAPVNKYHSNTASVLSDKHFIVIMLSESGSMPSSQALD